MNSSIRKYAAKQGAVTGVCTVVICLILFFFMIKSSVPLSTVYTDLPLTIGPTGFLCALIQVFTTKSFVKKGVVPVVGSLENQAAYLLVPPNSLAFLVYFTALELLLFAFAPIGILTMVGKEIPRFGYIVLKSLLAGCAGGVSTYHANIFICGLHQEKLTAAEKT